MNFKLPELNYAYDALQPYNEAKTMEIHHSKHHAGYTNNLNNVIKDTDFENQSIESILNPSATCLQSIFNCETCRHANSENCVRRVFKYETHFTHVSINNTFIRIDQKKSAKLVIFFIYERYCFFSPPVRQKMAKNFNGL